MRCTVINAGIFKPAPPQVVGLDNAAFSTGLSFSFTCSGSNRLLLVYVTSSGAASSVTYNGVGMTFDSQTGGGFNTEIWKLVAPSSGSNTISVTLGSGTIRGVGVMSFTGVHQTTPLGTSATTSGSGTSGTVSPSGLVSGDLYSASYLWTDNTATLTPSAATQAYQAVSSSGSQKIIGIYGTGSLTVTSDVSTGFSGIGITIKHA